MPAMARATMTPETAKKRTGCVMSVSSCIVALCPGLKIESNPRVYSALARLAFEGQRGSGAQDSDPCAETPRGMPSAGRVAVQVNAGGITPNVDPGIQRKQ